MALLVLPGAIPAVHTNVIMVKLPAPDKGGAPAHTMRQDNVHVDVEVFLRTNPAGLIPITRFDGKQLIPET